MKTKRTNVSTTCHLESDQFQDAPPFLTTEVELNAQFLYRVTHLLADLGWVD